MERRAGSTPENQRDIVVDARDGTYQGAGSRFRVQLRRPHCPRSMALFILAFIYRRA